jgi:hypothetical protein
MDNDTPITVCYALELTQGQYEDRFSKVVAVYADKFAAEYEVRKLNTALGILQGLIKAESILQEAWHNANPRDDSWYGPQSPDAPTGEYLVWINSRDAEYSRLNILLGIEKEAERLGVYHHDVEHARASLSEIPFTPMKG